MKKCFTEELIIGILKEAKAGIKVTELCRKHRILDATYYNRKSEFSGMSVSEAQRLRALVLENSKLKRILANRHLAIAALKNVVGCKW
jgi:putative transposase